MLVVGIRLNPPLCHLDPPARHSKILYQYRIDRQTRRKELTCPKLLMRFTAAAAAETHCQAGAVAIATQRSFDWLDGVV